MVVQPEHMQIEAGIGRTESEVGHVLKPITERPMARQLSFQTNVACELKGHAEISPVELLPAEQSGAQTSLQSYRNMTIGQNKFRAGSADKAGIAIVAQETGRELHAGTQRKTGGKVPWFGQVPNGAYFILDEELLVVA